MQRPSSQSAPSLVRPDSDTKSVSDILNAENYLLRTCRIWNKVTLLESVGMVKDECDRFSYALRFAELELQKACTEIADLRRQLEAAWKV